MTFPSARLPILALLLFGCEEQAAVAPAPRPEPLGVPMDGLPGARAVADQGGFVAEVAPGGSLVVKGPDGSAHAVDEEVRAELAFSPDGRMLAYARQSEGEDSDLYLVSLPPRDDPQRLTDWPGAEDRPAFSPDGRQLAFVSGRTGIASLWMISLDDPGAEPVQLTNLELEKQPRLPGQPPPGFVPPPMGDDLRWTAQGLEWSVQGRQLRVEAP